MKKPLFVSALVLGASMFVAAQQAPPASTPPTFPSDSTQQQTPAQQHPDAMPNSTPSASPQSTAPDTSAPVSQSDQGSSSAKAQSIEGCVSQDTGMAGGFVLTDNSGTKYSLAGDTSKLSSFVGQEVKVKGSVAAAAAPSSADQSSSSASSTAPAAGAASAAAQQQLTVQSVKKVADTCSNAAPAK